jgi:hypothetical protein
MGLFDEAALESAILELLKKQNYEYIHGSFVHKEITEILLVDDFENYFTTRFNDFKIDEGEFELIFSQLEAISKYPLYEGNKKFSE